MLDTLIDKRSKSCGCKVNRTRKYKCDLQYFEKIDREDKAYFLGLLYADGCNYGHLRVTDLKLQEVDRHILVDFARYLKSNYKIKYINRPSRQFFKDRNKYYHIKKQYCLTLNSAKICHDLKKLGCHPNKTRTLKFPSNKQVPCRLLSHFIRGFFDGDGCIWQGKIKTQTKFSMTGTVNMITGVQKILMKKLKFKKTKIVVNKNKICCLLEYNGRKQVAKFYNYIYKDANVFFIRKKNKMANIIN